MKRICLFLLSAAVLCSSVFFSGCSNEPLIDESSLSAKYTKDLAGTTLNFYNWADYISDGSDDSLDVIAAFEEITGINVNLVTFESNEVMYSKLKSGSVSFDVAIPSDYMIGRMIKEGMLRKIDYSKVTNYKNIDDKYKHIYFDPNDEYSIPYTVGFIGLIYNKKMVSEAPTSWDILWNEQYKDQILMFNNPRDSFAIAQSLLGMSFNTTDKAEWRKAADKLKEQNGIIQGRVMEETFNKMESGNAALAPYYAGDFIVMQRENPDLDMVYPKEHTNIFVDSMCIPQCCENYEGALMFINFLLEKEIGTPNAEFIGYASPNTEVINNPDYAFTGNKYLYPDDEVVSKAEYFKDLDSDIISYYESLWVEVTTE